MESQSKSIILMGAGGHASVLADILISQNRNIEAVFSPDTPNSLGILRDIPHYSSDKNLINFNSSESLLVNAIGQLPYSNKRNKLVNAIFTKGFTFEQIIADSAYVSKFASLGEGVQVMPGAIIHAGAVVDAHSIINSNAVIEHNCIIGKFNHIAPSATICGQVKTGKNVFIGAGSTIKQDINIGKNSVVGACTFVDKDIPDGVVIKQDNAQKWEDRR